MHQYPILPVTTAIFAVQNMCLPRDFVTFTGGEPLLNQEWIEAVIRGTRKFRVRYGLHTNGTLLSKMTPYIRNHLDQIQISIDGPKNDNDMSRGEGTFDRVTKEVQKFQTMTDDKTVEMIARMTITPSAGLYRSVLGVAKNFSKIYWQFQNRPDGDAMDLQERLHDLTELVDWWVHRLLTGEERVILVPFDNVAHRLLYPQLYDPFENLVAGCGAGTHHMTAFNDGIVYACPEQILNPRFCLGPIAQLHHHREIQIGDTPESRVCLTCTDRHICGCRCLHYVTEQYCECIRHVIKLIKDIQAYGGFADIAFDRVENIESMF